MSSASYMDNWCIIQGVLNVCRVLQSCGLQINGMKQILSAQVTKFKKECLNAYTVKLSNGLIAQQVKIRRE